MNQIGLFAVTGWDIECRIARAAWAAWAPVRTLCSASLPLLFFLVTIPARTHESYMVPCNGERQAALTNRRPCSASGGTAPRVALFGMARRLCCLALPPHAHI
eukprot:28224-Chlamydomonas_euryale.AAC.11